MQGEQNRCAWRKTYFSANLSTAYPTLTSPEFSLGLCDEKPGANRLNCGK